MRWLYGFPFVFFIQFKVLQCSSYVEYSQTLYCSIHYAFMKIKKGFRTLLSQNKTIISQINNYCRWSMTIPKNLILKHVKFLDFLIRKANTGERYVEVRIHNGTK